MSRLSDNFGVALVKEACPICCKEVDGPIIIGKNNSKTKAKAINDMHGKVVGFAKEPCPKCKELIDNGCFFIIGIIASKSDDMSNPYRSGHIVGISRESKFYKSLDPGFRKKDAVYMDSQQMLKLGLLKEL